MRSSQDSPKQPNLTIGPTKKFNQSRDANPRVGPRHPPGAGPSPAVAENGGIFESPVPRGLFF